MSVEHATDYGPPLVAILFGIAFSCLFLGMAMFLGPKRNDAEKLSPFECGSEPIGSPRVRFSVKFYQVALLFLIFDIEAAFLYPWAAIYRRLSCLGAVVQSECIGTVTSFGFVEMMVFMATLVVALAYVWRKRAIGWG
ncbi:MAG TPA: NADH-quinone oxidoreductase subunit A [Pseudomonadota bacterium]|nr:NADH-quinone oxidoreductase subunit A [Pseudomonadota bacterium]